jgi:F-box protein 9
MFIGTWELHDTTVSIRNLLDAAYLPLPSHLSALASTGLEMPCVATSLAPSSNHAPNFPPQQQHVAPPYSSAPRYNFQMHLNLRSRPLGRWNKLELLAYESVAMESGEVCDLSLKNERGFWFSRVRSWSW